MFDCTACFEHRVGADEASQSTRTQRGPNPDNRQCNQQSERCPAFIGEDRKSQSGEDNNADGVEIPKDDGKRSQAKCEWILVDEPAAGAKLFLPIVQKLIGV